MTTHSPEIGEVGTHHCALTETIKRARNEIPLYAKLHAGISSLDLADLPSCSKSDLQPFGMLPLSAGPLSDMYRVSATSGTTGARLFIGYTANDWAAIGTQYKHIAACIGLSSKDVLLNTHGGGLWIGASSLDELAHAAGAGVVPCGPSGPEQVLEWLRSLPITAISATPSYMRLLTEHAALNHIELSDLPLRIGILGGEGSSPSLKQKVCDAFSGGFHWQEGYGSTETGGPILAFAPPDTPFAGHLNINTDYFIVELLHPDKDEPVAPGEVGEITLSTPYREGTVLLRYRTRDLATALPGNRDSSGWPQITSVLGRIDDAIKVRGALVYPSVIEAVLTGRLNPGAEWRIQVGRRAGSTDVMTITYEHDSDALSDSLERQLRKHLGLRPILTRIEPGALERFSGKAKRVADDRDD